MLVTPPSACLPCLLHQSHFSSLILLTLNSCCLLCMKVCAGDVAWRRLVMLALFLIGNSSHLNSFCSVCPVHGGFVLNSGNCLLGQFLFYMIFFTLDDTIECSCWCVLQVWDSPIQWVNIAMGSDSLTSSESNSKQFELVLMGLFHVTCVFESSALIQQTLCHWTFFKIVLLWIIWWFCCCGYLFVCVLLSQVFWSKQLKNTVFN